MKRKGYLLIDILLSIALLVIVASILIPLLIGLGKQKNNLIKRLEMVKLAENAMEEQVAIKYKEEELTNQEYEEGDYKVEVEINNYSKEILQVNVRIKDKNDESYKVEFEKLLSEKGIYFNWTINFHWTSSNSVLSIN